ncbi:CapA family protein [Leptospira sp. 85282-16]|uniref:CapA family protein n=1 Tax=Leptospira montravelensis TaxID=2484961 RepID=A0ABY2LSZ5_9LEPT|nr:MULTISPECIES: CapA family protein [Leptospira]MCT8332101.1 CapA family protein [Leptospira sp. 85282-16]TGK83339.1 CapA family protein [Leptospira montravelensis]TGL05341.1 CapA family protein [Leptospira montravelensis]
MNLFRIGYSIVFVLPFLLFAADLPESAESKLELPISDLYRFQTESGETIQYAKSTKLWFGGDVMFNWGVRDSMRSEDPYFPFRSFISYLKNFDFRFLNLETPILHKTPTADQRKSYVFFGEKKDLTVLQLLGIDGVFLGNNHTMDFGENGLSDTLDLLDEFGIRHTGAGKNTDEALVPITVSKQNTEYRIFSFSDTGETRLFSGIKSPGAAYFRVGVAERLIKKTKPNQVNILSVHWGVEYNPFPMDTERNAAKYLVNAGYRVILGHHPHVPQGIEVFPKGVVIYSLGNFLFGSKNQYLKHNISVVLHFDADKLLFVEVVPVFGKHQSLSGDHYFFPLGPKEAESFLKEYAVLCKQLGTDLVISGGRGYVFLDKELKAKLKP